MPRRRKTVTFIDKQGNVQRGPAPIKTDWSIYRKPEEVQPTPQKPYLVSLFLTVKHSINGSYYGPGQVTVPNSTADVLRENERNMSIANQNFLGGRSGIIMPGNRLVAVHPNVLNGDRIPELFATPTFN